MGAARTAGVSGTAVGLATTGLFLVWAAIENVGIKEGIRSIIGGTLPTSQGGEHAEVPAELNFINAGSGGGSGSGGGTGSGDGNAIVAAARKYLGIPYVWGGATPKGFDCSGLVTWVLHHDLGYDLPSNAHTTAARFLVWKGAKTIPRDQAAAGDLCCWTSHIGIAVDNKRMINAPQPGDVVKEANIYSGVTIRRVNGTGTKMVKNSAGWLVPASMQGRAKKAGSPAATPAPTGKTGSTGGAGGGTTPGG